jgi:hypothetical protein
MKLRRKTNIGRHRVNIPGKGWISVGPGDMIVDKKGKEIEFEDLSFLGSQIRNYEIIGGEGNTPPEQEEQGEGKEGFSLELQQIGKTKTWNVVNSVTKKPINEYPLTKKQAQEFFGELMEEISPPGECPLEDGIFGETWNEFEECVNCPQGKPCEEKAEK